MSDVWRERPGNGVYWMAWEGEPPFLVAVDGSHVVAFQDSNPWLVWDLNKDSGLYFLGPIEIPIFVCPVEPPKD